MQGAQKALKKFAKFSGALQGALSNKKYVGRLARRPLVIHQEVANPRERLSKPALGKSRKPALRSRESRLWDLANFTSPLWAPCKAPKCSFSISFLIAPTYFGRLARRPTHIALLLIFLSAYVFWAPCKAPESAQEICYWDPGRAGEVI